MRLRERTRSEIVVAWAPRDDGSPDVAAAAFGAEPPLTPNALEFETTLRLEGASALLAPGSNATLRGLAARHGLAAAAPVKAADGRALAVLLSGSSDGAAARPRALAALAATASRLALPLAAAEAERRLTRLDTELQRLDRLAGLGRLTQELAHEVRNPLVSVKTFLQLLPERRDDPDFTTRFLAVAAGELERTLRLLDLMIEHPRPRPATAEPTPIAETIACVLELLQPYARQRGVTIAAKLAPALPAVACAEDGLRQVLLNLLMNAIDATPRDAAVSVSAQLHEGNIELVVSDAGPGIPPDLRERVFEPFFTTRGGRHGGIGLAIARNLVEQAHGRITLRAAGRKGAAFVVTLPAVGES